MTLRTQLYLDGEFRDSAGKTPLVDPATEETWCEVSAASPADVETAIDGARRAWEQGWRDMAPGGRAEILFSISRKLREHAEELAQLEMRNVGKPISDARSEAALGARVFEYYAGAVTKFCGRTIPVARGGFDFTLRQPMGVVAAIAPWNFPLPISCWKVAPALAAGNCVVLKPASLSPLTALRLGDLAHEAGLPAGVLQVLPGPGGAIGDALVRHPGVRKISFTGSTAVGARIMELAAPQTRVARARRQIAEHRFRRCGSRRRRDDSPDERIRERRPGLLHAQPGVRGKARVRRIRRAFRRHHARVDHRKSR